MYQPLITLKVPNSKRHAPKRYRTRTARYQGSQFPHSRSKSWDGLKIASCRMLFCSQQIGKGLKKNHPLNHQLFLIEIIRRHNYTRTTKLVLFHILCSSIARIWKVHLNFCLFHQHRTLVKNSALLLQQEHSFMNIRVLLTSISRLMLAQCLNSNYNRYVESLVWL